jgi:hypothetical protein
MRRRVRVSSRWRRLIRKRFKSWKATTSKTLAIIPGDEIKDGQMVFWGGENVDGHPIVYAILADEQNAEE